jgi:hypothetical protein
MGFAGAGALPEIDGEGVPAPARARWSRCVDVHRFSRLLSLKRLEKFLFKLISSIALIRQIALLDSVRGIWPRCTPRSALQESALQEPGDAIHEDHS